MIRLGMARVAAFAIRSALDCGSASVLVAWISVAASALRGAVSRG